MATASGQPFRNRANREASFAFHDHYLPLEIPPGSSADPPDALSRLQLIVNLIALRSNFGFLHVPSDSVSCCPANLLYCKLTSLHFNPAYRSPSL